MLTQNAKSSKLYSQYVQAVVEENCADATLRMHAARTERFEAMVEYNKSQGVEEGEILWALPSKR